jgi:hypothetical protein
MGEGLPEAIIGDAGRLRQIVLNLLSNAVKFTDDGEVVMSVEAAAPAGGNTWTIAIEVRDTGIGIPPDRMDLLFQSFSQVDASISRRYGGTGLGLAISRRLAESMGGSLTATSSGIAGEGSVFRLTLPAQATTLPDAAPAASERSLRGCRVLVVDAGASNRRPPHLPWRRSNGFAGGRHSTPRSSICRCPSATVSSLPAISSTFGPTIPCR